MHTPPRLSRLRKGSQIRRCLKYPLLSLESRKFRFFRRRRAFLRPVRNGIAKMVLTGEANEYLEIGQ